MAKKVNGGPLNDKTNHGKLLNSVYASALGNYYPLGGPINTDGPRAEEIVTNPLDYEYQPSETEKANMMNTIVQNAAKGNIAARRMMNPNAQSYTFTGDEYDEQRQEPAGVPAGEKGSHYSASMGNYFVPFIQQGEDGQLHYNGYANPNDKEAIEFKNDQDAEFFANHYKKANPPMMRNWGKEYKNGGQFPTPYSLPEDSFKQGGNNLHNSIYASSPAQYPALYRLGGYIGESTRQQMYMPLDHVTKNGGSILSMSNTPQLEGEGKDLNPPHNFKTGGVVLTSQLFIK